MSQSYAKSPAAERRFTTKEMVLVGMFAAVLAVISQISLPMPTGVPITIQVFGVAVAVIPWIQAWNYRNLGICSSGSYRTSDLCQFFRRGQQYCRRYRRIYLGMADHGLAVRNSPENRE